MFKLRLSGAVLGMALLAVAAPAVAAPTPPLPTRLTIGAILISNGQDQVDSDLRTWANLLSSQLTGMLADSRYNLKYAAQIEVKQRFEPTMPNVATLERRWTQTAAIQLITATGTPASGGTLLQGGIYLGGLKGDLAQPTVPLRQTIKASEYQATRDVVSLAAFYALAVDAGGAKPVACPLLDEARSIRDDLKKRKVDVASLSVAIDARTAALSCQVVR